MLSYKNWVLGIKVIWEIGFSKSQMEKKSCKSFSFFYNSKNFFPKPKSQRLTEKSSSEFFDM